ncbi:MAG: hypothetical protein HY707_10435 [Ignavibacteriae bacterium]|nr:hypothetical protein [Ignavibacteriota bacterium]
MKISLESHVSLLYLVAISYDLLNIHIGPLMDDGSKGISIFDNLIEKLNALSDDLAKRLKTYVDAQLALGRTREDILLELEESRKSGKGIFEGLFDQQELDKLIRESIQPYRITKAEIAKRIQDQYRTQLLRNVNHFSHQANAKNVENDFQSALEMDIRAIQLTTHAISAHNQIQTISELCKSVDRINRVTRKLRDAKLGLSCLAWYRSSQFWDIGLQRSPKFHVKLQEKLPPDQDANVADAFLSILTSNKSWLECQLAGIEKESFFEEKYKSGIFRLGTDCRTNKCDVCMRFDGVDIDEYPIDEIIQPIPPVLECILRDEEDETRCDCRKESRTIRIDLREQLKLLELEESGLLKCKHEEGREYVCKHCGLLMK